MTESTARKPASVYHQPDESAFYWQAIKPPTEADIADIIATAHKARAKFVLVMVGHQGVRMPDPSNESKIVSANSGDVVGYSHLSDEVIRILRMHGKDRIRVQIQDNDKASLKEYKDKMKNFSYTTA